MKTDRNAQRLAVLGLALLGCGGRFNAPDATGGSGGVGSSSTGSSGTSVGGFAGSVGSSTATGSATTGITTVGVGTASATAAGGMGGMSGTGGRTTGTGATGGMGGKGGGTGGTGGLSGATGGKGGMGGATGGNGGMGGSTGGNGGGRGGGDGGTIDPNACSPFTWPGLAPWPVTTATCSDFDADDDPRRIHCVMPGGIWDVDVDGVGTDRVASFKVEPCGTNGNGFHFVGQGHTVWGADVAAAVVSQVQPVDVSAYSGLSFVMKSTTASSLIFLVQNSYSQPACGLCTEGDPVNDCYSGYWKPVALPAGSTAPIVVKWADLTQQTWGYMRPGSAAFDPKDLVSIAFAFDRYVDFDVCLDDIKFVP